jgi:hypothetical protein
MPALLWEELSKRPRLIPLPTPHPSDNLILSKTSGAVLYQDYDTVKYENTINIHRPSYKPPSAASSDAKALDKDVSNQTRPTHLSINATLFHKSYVRHFVNCQNCGKRRVIYAWPIIGMNVAARLNELKGYLSEPLFEYICGDSLFGRVEDPEPHPPEIGVFHVRQALNCSIPMESHYFSSEKFLSVCAHCGNDEDHVPVQEVESSTEGRKAYSICRDCFKEGKKPLHHGQKTKTGSSIVNRKRGQHYVQKLSAKEKSVLEKENNKKVRDDRKEKKFTSIFDTKKKSATEEKKRVPQPLPDWAKDTLVPVKPMRIKCLIQDTLERVFHLFDVDGDGHCGYHVLKLFLEKTGRQENITMNDFRLGLVQYAIDNVEELMEQGSYFGSNTSYKHDLLQLQLDRIHPGGDKVFDQSCDSTYWMFVDWAIPLAQWKYKFNAVLFSDGHGHNGLTTYSFTWKDNNATMTNCMGTNLPDPEVDDMIDTLYFVQINSSHYIYLDPK